MPLRDPRLVLLEALRDHAVIHGEFVGAAGKQLPYFIEAQRALLTRHGMKAAGILLADLCDEYEVSAIGGPASGAIACACAAVNKRAGLKGFYIKRHHLTGAIDLSGQVTPQDRVLMVEDVVTTGGTLQWAIDHLRDYEGIETSAAVAVVDRSEGPISLSVPFRTLVSVDWILR